MVTNKILEEKLNTYSHAIGIILALLGTVHLLKQPIQAPYVKGGLIIYCCTMIMLFSASTLYHAAHKPIKKQKLRILDHISIYFLIAGTYTPVCLILLQSSKGWLLIWLVWGITLLGIILKLFFTGRFEAFSLILYALMGWLIVIDFTSLLERMPSQSLFYLSMGGAFYTIGILFYAVKKIPYNHLIWHFFVLGGAISHWLMVYTIL